MSDKKDVHTEHCCLKHGCKYGDDYCPVAGGKKKQSYPCESCEYDEEMSEEMTGVNDMAEKLIDLGITYDVACKLTASAVHYDYKEGAYIFALVAQKLLQRGEHKNP